MKKAACGFVFMMVLMASAIANAQLQYVTNADEISVTVTNYLGDVPSQIIIPDTLDGLAVTGIAYEAFGDFFTNLQSVIIPNSVTSLGTAVFVFSGITNLVIPSSITNIPEATFEECHSLANVFIPDSVVSIGQYPFVDSGLNSLTIPGSLTNIGEGAFAGCASLTNLIISYGVPYISSDMFSGNPLTSVTIPGSVTNIGDSAFEASGYLSNVFFTGNAPAVLPTSFEQVIVNPFGSDTDYIAATAYYLPGTTGWAEFSSNTTMTPSEFNVTSNIFVPAVLWDPAIHAKGTNFGVQNGQYGFDITGTTNLPIAVEACDDLSQSNWVVLKRLTLTNGLFHFSEPLQTNSSSRFYRIGFP